jgi:cell division septum initiation protein DivIVA
MASTTFNPVGKEAEKKNQSSDKGVKEEGKQNEPFDKAREAGAQAVDKAKEAVASVGDMATQAVSAVGKKADDLVANAGSDIRKLGDTLSAKGSQPGLMGHASQVAADALRGSGHYLEEAKFSGMADDVVKIVQRNPGPAVVVSFALGFMVARALRS